MPRKLKGLPILPKTFLLEFLLRLLQGTHAAEPARRVWLAFRVFNFVVRVRGAAGTVFGHVHALGFVPNARLGHLELGDCV